MKQVFLYDENGFYLHPIIIADDADMPENCTDETWDKLHKPRRQNGVWVEGATPEEVAPPPIILPTPTLDQRTDALEAAMLAMMGGGLDV